MRFILEAFGLVYISIEKFVEYPDDGEILGVNIDDDLHKMCKDKNVEEIASLIHEAKLNHAPRIVIQQLQQHYDKLIKQKKRNEITLKPVVVMSAWRNYCRESWLYRFLERIGLR